MNGSPGHDTRVPLGVAFLPQEVSRKREIILVASLSLLGLSLRLIGLSYGLPDHMFHSDTQKQLERVPDFMRGELIPDDIYPTLHMYIVALLLKLVFVFDGHSLASDPSFSQVAITARLLNGFFGAGIIPLVYVIGRWFLDWQLAALAAAFVSVNALHILHSHYETGDIPQSFFVMAGLAAAVPLFSVPRLPPFLLAGAFAGLAASTKYYGVVVFGALVVSALWGRRPGWRRRLVLLLASGTTAVAFFVLTTPKLLLTPVDFFRELLDSPERFPVPPVPILARPLVGGTVLAGLSYEIFGVLLLGLTALGTLVLVRTRALILLLVTPALVAALYVGVHPNFLDDRNLVIFAPFVCLLAAAAVGWLCSRARILRLAGIVVGGALLLSAAVDSLHTAYLFWQDDTVLFAERWASQNVLASASVMEKPYFPSPDEFRKLRADFIVTDSQDFNRYLHRVSFSEVVQRALDFLAERGKLLKRFELLPRAFTDRTISYYDADSMMVPYVFPPPDDVAVIPDTLTFFDADAVPDRVGVIVNRRRPATQTLVSRASIPEIGVALSGIGRMSIHQGWRRVQVALSPGQTQVVLLHPWRTFPWFKYFYRIRIEARDGQGYARFLASPCEIARAFLAIQRWASAISYLESCQGTRWAEPARLLDLAWAQAQLGHPAEAEQALEQLRRIAPGLLEALSELAREENGEARRERYRTLAGHGRWFWHHHIFTIQAEESALRFGTIVTNERAHQGKAVIARPDTTPPGYLKIWFPQHFLRGQYLVTFRLRGTARATLSVVRHFQDRVHDVPVSRDWHGDSAQPSFREVVLPVSTDLEPIKLEGRVYYHGGGILEVDEISVVPDVRSTLAAKLDAVRDLLRDPGGQ